MLLVLGRHQPQAARLLQAACFVLCENVQMVMMDLVMIFKVLVLMVMVVLLFVHLRLLVLRAQLHTGLYSTWWGSISNSPIVSCCLLYFVYFNLVMMVVVL